MVRTQLYLPRSLHGRLRKHASEKGTTISALVRKALERMYGENVPVGSWERAVDGVAGMWTSREDIDDEWCARIRSGSRRLGEVRARRKRG